MDEGSKLCFTSFRVGVPVGHDVEIAQGGR